MKTRLVQLDLRGTLKQEDLLVRKKQHGVRYLGLLVLPLGLVLQLVLHLYFLVL
jgi:hypothetical protein